MAKFEFSVAKSDDYVFVNGNTRYLSDCSQADLAVLAKNGDKRVKRVKIKVETPKTEETAKTEES